MLIILVLLLALSGWWLWREWQKDVCSERGGEWHHASGTCGPRS